MLNKVIERLSSRVRTTPPGTTVVAGATSISVSTAEPAGARLAKWAANWKTSLIARILSHRPGVFLDVGANVGQTMVDYLASGTGGGYIGFEPNSRAASYVDGLIACNSLTDCSIVPAALSGRNGILTLYSLPGRPVDGSATILEDLRPGRQLHRKRIACYRFDDIQSDLLEGRPVSLIKIDVEGAEHSVLEGMTEFLQTGPWIICEILGRDSRAAVSDHRRRMSDLADFLHRAGYAAFNIRKCPDQLTVAEVIKVDTFPDTVWTNENQHDFDYVLVPTAHEAQLLDLVRR